MWWARWPRWVRRAVWSVAAGALVGLAAFGVWWKIQLPLPAVVADHRPLVVIDAGHGGMDGGTQGFGVLEKQVALATAVRASRELRQRGVRTALTRETDVALRLDDRIAIVNDREAEAFVSVHFNFSVESPAVRGVEAFYSDPKDLSAQTAMAGRLGVPLDDPGVAFESAALAAAVRAGISKRADTPDRGTRNRPELAVTRRTRCASVLVECAYLSNQTDARRASTAEWQAKVAQGIADGVVEWLDARGRR